MLLPRSENADLAAEQSAVVAFIANRDDVRAKRTLDMIAAMGRRALAQVHLRMPELDHRLVLRERDIASSRATLLELIALEGRSDDGSFAPYSVYAHANALAHMLNTELRLFQVVYRARCAIEDLDAEPHTLRGSLIALGRGLAEAPDALELVLVHVRRCTTREQRQSLLEGMLTAGSSAGAEQRDFERVLHVAKALWTIDHLGAPFAPKVGSRPLLDQLFAQAGQRLTVQLDARTITGKLVRLEDPLASQGGRPQMHLRVGSEAVRVDLTTVLRIEAADQVLFTQTIGTQRQLV